ncbi:MAG TPA: beta-ketoacyl-[acyl-carrier-protein] synthase family protein [Steroidobacteraceae bacterium]|nr:beta-ketoacyl-[acyl-carrier-protein] synthase family protein [Steroidobacteraceae bacterium]
MSPAVPLQLTRFTATSCLGSGLASSRAALEQQRSGLAPCRFESARLDTYIGEVPGVDDVKLPSRLQRFDCRNNRLALLGLQQDNFEAAVRTSAARWGHRRVGVFLGTSTSGILSTEIAFRRLDPVTGALPGDFHYLGSHNSFSLVDFVRRYLELEGPAGTVCTACSSSAKVFATAQRLIALDLIDAALVGGVDSLCLTTLYGFHSLQLTSAAPCRPFDAARDGLSIGEAAAYALLERVPGSNAEPDSIRLLGVGESSDAYHMSSPHPEGTGARSAMQAALTAAHATPAEIDYINLHGTGTPSNDSAEDRAVTALFGAATPCSSTKGATGHALGAAGALEAVLCALTLQSGLMPGGLNTRQQDPRLKVNYLTANRRAPVRRVLSNSFGFGGANCALLFGRAA